MSQNPLCIRSFQVQMQKQEGKAIHDAADKGHVSDFLSRMFDDILAEEPCVPTMEASQKVMTPLLSHQQEALAWMVQRENNSDLPPFWEPHKVCHLCPAKHIGQLRTCLVSSTSPWPRASLVV
jgi:hypothetical protein